MTREQQHAEHKAWSYNMLAKTSRSFAGVIQALDSNLRDPMMVFYLTLRALDSVEDDPQYPLEKKIPELVHFYKRLDEETWNWTDVCGEKEAERDLLNNFHHVLAIYKSMDIKYQKVVSDITQRMGKGMSEFCTRMVVSVADWDLYCHYVAGLVGIGLSHLFAASGLEDPAYFNHAEEISNSCGLFLQKTNIIRDYLEDVDQERFFWPKGIWGLYTPAIANFKDHAYRTQALSCLNHLITNALQHAIDSLDYMLHIVEPSVFNFVAIPQVMAIGTLSECFNNHAVFTGVVKIARKTTMQIIGDLQGKRIVAVCDYYQQYAQVILAKISENDPSASKTTDTCQRIIQKVASIRNASAKL